MLFEAEFGSERYMIGDKVTVRVFAASTETRRIDFEWCKITRINNAPATIRTKNKEKILKCPNKSYWQAFTP